MSTLNYLIKRHEGLRLLPYRDTEGVLTIGYGHNLEKGITQETAEFILQCDIQDAMQDAKKLFPELETYGIGRQAVLVSMAFNLGLKRLSGFKKMIGAVLSKQWDTAADEMLQSKWAGQVGKRANELADMMREG